MPTTCFLATAPQRQQCAFATRVTGHRIHPFDLGHGHPRFLRELNKTETTAREKTLMTLMVHLQLGKENNGLLSVTSELAARADAAVIGVAACQPMQIAFSDGFYYSGEIIEQDRKALERDISAAESEFRNSLSEKVMSIAWRSAITLAPLAVYLGHQARGADLLITTVDRDQSLFDPSRHADVGDLVMQAGRPILLVPNDTNQLKLSHVMIGWNDSREIRRATLDALPILRLAQRVTVMQLATEIERETAKKHVEDVANWLQMHKIQANPVVAPSTGNDAIALNEIAEKEAVDLLVIGAYGHSRLREWILGGVTRDLLLFARRCTLTSR